MKIDISEQKHRYEKVNEVGEPLGMTRTLVIPNLQWFISVAFGLPVTL